MNRPIAHIQRDAAFRDLAEIRKIVGANEEELIQDAIKRLLSQRDNAWQELRDIREAVAADSEESTLDEVRRVVLQRDLWKDDFEMQFKASEARAA